MQAGRMQLPGYRIIGVIHQGNKCIIYKGLRESDSLEVCIKAEIIENQTHFKKEQLILNIIKDSPGFPILHSCATNEKFTYISMELLGNSLGKLKSMMRQPFSLKTTLMLADQMVSRLQLLHIHGFVHRDVKPDNFAMGRLSHLNQVYLIDFGLSRQYLDLETGKPKPTKRIISFTGTVLFAPISALKFEPSFPKDDIESLMYTLVYLLKGTLPWEGQKDNLYAIARERESYTSEVICEGLPKIFSTLMDYARGLKPMEPINYSMIRKEFRNLMKENGYLYDGRYDWHQPIPRKIQNRTPPPMKLEVPKIRKYVSLSSINLKK